jgi:hypothetical protein
MAHFVAHPFHPRLKRKLNISVDREELRLVFSDFLRTDAYQIVIHPADMTREQRGNKRGLISSYTYPPIRSNLDTVLTASVR